MRCAAAAAAARSFGSRVIGGEVRWCCCLRLCASRGRAQFDHARSLDQIAGSGSGSGRKMGVGSVCLREGSGLECALHEAELGCRRSRIGIRDTSISLSVGVNRARVPRGAG